MPKPPSISCNWRKDPNINGIGSDLGNISPQTFHYFYKINYKIYLKDIGSSIIRYIQ